MRKEEQFFMTLCSESLVVESGDHGLSSPGSSDDEIAEMSARGSCESEVL